MPVNAQPPQKQERQADDELNQWWTTNKEDGNTVRMYALSKVSKAEGEIQILFLDYSDDEKVIMATILQQGTVHFRQVTRQRANNLWRKKKEEERYTQIDADIVYTRILKELKGFV